MSKTSRLDTIFFDEPPYYKEDVLINLEEMNATSSQSARELNKNFQNISKTLINDSNKVISTLENEAVKARIQSAIENERTTSGISETNYRLLDVANGIEGLGDVIRYGNENIVNAIGRSGEQILKGLESIDSTLNDIDYQMEMVNSSLGVISNQLGELLKKISKPNETEALELADQARINLSLKKKEIALKVTRSALELSNGTSITVLAYHILTLSLFDDEASRKEIIEIYEDYVNLIGFKLSDRQSDTEVVIQEIDNTLFPVMATMGNNVDDAIMLLTQTLYISLYENRDKIDNILGKPLIHGATLEMINQPNQLREFHWTVLLKEYVLKKQSLYIYTAYIVALAKSNVLIKNELIILVIKHFYDEGFLYGIAVDNLAGNGDEIQNDALKVIISLLPQDIIEIDHKTYWTMELYADQHSLKVNSLLESKFQMASEYVEADIDDNYIAFFDNTKQDIYVRINQKKQQITAIKQESDDILQKKMKEWEKHNNTIYEKDYSKKKNDAQRIIYKLQKKDYDKFDELGDIGPSSAFGFIVSFFITAAIGATFGIEPPMSILFIIVGTVGLPFIPILILSTTKDIAKHNDMNKKNELLTNIDFYEKELAKAYSISTEKKKLNAPYEQKMHALIAQEEVYKENRIDDINAKLDLLIKRYIPTKVEQLSNSYLEIKEYVDKKMLGKFISYKRPGALEILSIR